jgi:hypothetical protein
MPAVLAVAVAAVCAGAKSYTAMSEWALDVGSEVLAKLGVREGATPPSESTIRRTLARVDGDRLDAVLGGWMRIRTGDLGGRRVIAVDGKSVRGARSCGLPAPHLVSALGVLPTEVVGSVA